MTFTIPLPDWLPGWAPLAMMVPALLWLLAFLFVPFSVLGVKGRLEALEARMDELQGEIRTLALRMPEVPLARTYDDTYAPPPPRAPVDVDPPPRPPIPPARAGWRETREPPPPPRTAATSRAEPRLDWRGR